VKSTFLIAAARLNANRNRDLIFLILPDNQTPALPIGDLVESSRNRAPNKLFR
jgi:hypothetical protein